MTYTETDLVATIERLSGDAVSRLTQQQRDLLDQFHAGGPEAVDRVASGLHLAPGMTVLDVGSGLGGPARQVARSTGCRVVGIDITPAYVDTARALTRAGFPEQVEFRCVDIPDLDEGPFDAAYTMHVQMNVADKVAFFTEIARRLRPGARLAVFEVCRTGDAEPSTPLPWSQDGTDSFLVTADELRASIEKSGFTADEWVDETAWVRAWFQEMGGRMVAAAGTATLPALLHDGPIRMMNYAVAITGDVVSIHRGTFTRGPDQA